MLKLYIVIFWFGMEFSSTYKKQSLSDKSERLTAGAK